MTAMNSAFVPWEFRARFLDPSGPSNTSESWICCVSSFRKCCLAASPPRWLLGNEVFWTSLKLSRETRPSVKLADAAFGGQRSTWSPDIQSVGGVKITSSYKLQSCSQSLNPSHLHLHAEGAELTSQSLQNVLRRLRRRSQGWSEGGGRSFSRHSQRA